MTNQHVTPGSYTVPPMERIGWGVPAAEIAQVAVTAGVNDMAGLRALIGVTATAPLAIRQLVVPTTLSGSEFTNLRRQPSTG